MTGANELLYQYVQIL